MSGSGLPATTLKDSHNEIMLKVSLLLSFLQRIFISKKVFDSVSYYNVPFLHIDVSVY